MKDLQSQLISKLGATAPAQAPAPAPAAPSGLDPDAHLRTRWWELLRASRAPGAPEIPPRPNLNAARQLTDKMAKALKNAGHARAASELVKERDDFLGKREKLLWGLIKERWEALALSERAYRALKQGEADPDKLWQKLSRAPDAELKGMGADRLKEWLG